jgi:uncharacterized protein (DUF952 family)
MIYHITSASHWQKALELGVYQADSLQTEGFIHCSTQAQVSKVANAFYRGQKQLIVLEIAPEKLHSPLHWESPLHPDGGILPSLEVYEKFPHIYGTINPEAVIRVIALELEPNGSFILNPLKLLDNHED